MKNTLCIYHGGCPDGFASAYIVWKKFGKDVEFYPGKYQEDPPDVKDKNVIFVDFTYKLPAMEKLLKRCSHLTVLDHHQSAEKDLEGLKDKEKCQIVFDQKHCGCIITWNVFFPDKPLPEFLEYIQDRDLWTLKLPDNDAFYYALTSYPQDFEVWKENVDDKVTELIKDGKVIKKFYETKMKEVIENQYELEIAGFKVPVCNIPWFMASDVAGKLAKGKPFAAGYWDTAEGRVFSLRSAEDGEDVSKIAEQFGGGGHVRAAGFKVKLEKTSLDSKQ